MGKLFFGDFITTLNTFFVLALLVLSVFAVVQGSKVQKWGRLIALFIVMGTAVSGLSATRDSFMTANALFAVDAFQSIICSIAGGAIFLAGVISIFFKKQKIKRVFFYTISVLFVIQVLTVEISRVSGVVG